MVFGIDTPTLLAFARSLSTLFLNLIKSIIAPLIFATLVVGIAGTGDIKQVGRIGVKALVYFEIVTTLALFIGLAAVNITRPGDGVSLGGRSSKRPTTKRTVCSKGGRRCQKKRTTPQKRPTNCWHRVRGDPAIAAEAQQQSAIAAQKAAEAADAASKGLTAGDPPAKPQTFGDIISHLSPTSIIKAMADGDVLADRRLFGHICACRHGDRQKGRARCWTGASRWRTSCFGLRSM